MAFSKLIISQVVKMAKESSKLEELIESSKEKFIGKVDEEVQSKVPIPLPFGVKDALEGNITLDKSTTQSYLPSKEEAMQMGIDRIPDALKIQINETLDNLEDLLNDIIGRSNQIKLGLNTALIPLGTLNVLGTTLTTISQTLDAVIISMEVIQKTAPTPPPGAPLYPFTGLPQDVKDAAEFVNGPVKGASSILPPLIRQINGVFATVYAALAVLDGLVIPTSMLISFIRTFINIDTSTNSNLSEDFDENLNSVISKTVNSIPLTGLSSDPDANSNVDGDLEKRLQPNSTNPIWHRGYRLILQYDDKNKFSFPSRRIKGTNTNIDVNPIIYHLEDDSYSYSSSLQVMVNEIKNRIDDSLVIPVVPPPPPPIPIPPTPPDYSPFDSAGSFEGEIRKENGKYYKYNSQSSPLWSIYRLDTSPFNEFGKWHREIRSYYSKSQNKNLSYIWEEKLGGSINTQLLRWRKLSR